MEFGRNQKLALAALVGIAAIAVSIMYARNLTGAAPGSVEVFEASAGAGTRVAASDSDQVPNVGANNTGGKVVFQVAGCVNRPGVYTLDEGKRVIDAINAAGGAQPGADTQSLNLAAKIEDGQRIFVPQAQMNTGTPTQANTAAAAIAAASSPSTTPSASASPKSSSGSNKFKTPGEGTVSINSANVEELQRLPGVGPSTAQKIIDYRAQIGRFSTPEQLMDVKGIGPKKFEKMRPFISL